MLPSRLLIPLDQHVVTGIQEKDLILDFLLIHLIQDFFQPGEILPAPHIKPEGDLFHLFIRLPEHLHKAREKGDRQVIHAEIPHVFQHFKGC